MRIMFISSPGGHWVQLKMLSQHSTETDSFFVTTPEAGQDSLSNTFIVTDCNAKTPLKLLKCFTQSFSIIKKENPTTIISTGAAPGLMAILAGAILQKNTVWIDSIANSQTLSLSGKIAKYVARTCCSQWPDVAKSHNVKYLGSIL